MAQGWTVSLWLKLCAFSTFSDFWLSDALYWKFWYANFTIKVVCYRQFSCSCRFQCRAVSIKSFLLIWLKYFPLNEGTNFLVRPVSELLQSGCTFFTSISWFTKDGHWIVQAGYSVLWTPIRFVQNCFKEIVKW